MKFPKHLLSWGSGMLLIAMAAAAQTSPTPGAAQPPSTRPATLPTTVPATLPTTVPATAPVLPPLETEVVKLTLRPSATTRPALRYALLPEVVDQTPGDASLLYSFAAKLLPERYGELFPENEQVNYWYMPLDRLPLAEVDRALAKVAASMRYLDLAARREEARWDTSFREEGWDALLPHLGDVRDLTNLLRVKIRAQLARRDWAAAERSLQSGFSMARHLNDRPVLVQQLVATGIAEAMLSEGVWQWVGQGDSPNLYWALSGLPHPFLDPLPARAWERAGLAFTDPRFAKALAGTLPPEDWGPVLGKLAHHATRWHPSPEPAQPMTETERAAAAARLIESAHPRAKGFLLSAGLPAEQVHAMPAAQAVGTYFFREYQDFSDELWKGWELPYGQSLDLIPRQEQEYARRRAESPDNPLLLFGVQTWRVRGSLAQLDRHIALLRTVEAIRDYVARHEGRLPERLDQMVDLPLPINPMTGRPFAYRVEGRTVFLDAPPPQGVRMRSYRYELTYAP